MLIIVLVSKYLTLLAILATTAKFFWNPNGWKFDWAPVAAILVLTVTFIGLEYKSFDVSNPKNEVRTMARAFGLMDPKEPIEHLAFKEGDINFWANENIPLEQLRNEFECRSRALDYAAKEKRVILSQGDLSHLSQKLRKPISAGDKQ
jgi:hypothetical protein